MFKAAQPLSAHRGRVAQLVVEEVMQGREA